MHSPLISRGTLWYNVHLPRQTFNRNRGSVQMCCGSRSAVSRGRVVFSAAHDCSIRTDPLTSSVKTVSKRKLLFLDNTIYTCLMYFFFLPFVRLIKNINLPAPDVYYIFRFKSSRHSNVPDNWIQLLYCHWPLLSKRIGFRNAQNPQYPDRNIFFALVQKLVAVTDIPRFPR